MSNDLADAFAPGTIPGLKDGLYNARQRLKEAKSDEANLSTILREWMEKHDDLISSEGSPDLKLIDGNGGEFWDSHAVMKCIDEWPQEFRKLVELGAVTFNATVINDALKRGQLIRKPQGAQRKRVLKLVFDR